MFDYVLDGAWPSTYPTVWSRSPLRPLAPQALTPFSYSVLDEIAGRAWYHYFDRLGFEPRPRARVVQQLDGRPYLNLSLFAELDARHAGVEPLTLRINGQLQPIVAWEKPGLLAAIKTGRGQKKIDALLDTLQAEHEATANKARQWFIKTQELRWSQAEVLQVMEEIERVGNAPMLLFLATRHNLELAFNQVLRAILNAKPFPQNVALINAAFSDLTTLHEYRMGAELVKIGAAVQDRERVVTWLKQGDFTDWRQKLPDKRAVDGVESFLANHGHRASEDGEIRFARWHEDPAPILQALLVCLKKEAQRPVAVSANQSTQKLLELVDSKQRKSMQATLQKMRDLLDLQSQALHALGFVLAGTRRWAQAAAAEAMADGRLETFDDLFFFQLEEIKQMMTGEWNISARDEIHATGQARRAEFVRWQDLRRGDLLIGDREARQAQTALPGAGGQTAGPLRRADAAGANGCQSAIVGAVHLGNSCALALPVADGFVTASGSPLDPVAAAARPWHRPVVLAMVDGYDSLTDGAHTTVDGDTAVVDQ